MKKPEFRYEPSISPEFAKYALTIKESLDQVSIDFLLNNYRYACTGYIDGQPAMCGMIVKIVGVNIFGGAVVPRADTRFVFHYTLKAAQRLLSNVSRPTSKKSNNSFTETKNIIQSVYEEMLQMPPTTSGKKQEVLQFMSRRIYAELEKVPSFNPGTETEGYLQKLLGSLLQTGEIQETALRDMFESGFTSSPPGLQKTKDVSLVMPAMPLESPQTDEYETVRSVCRRNDNGTILTLGKLGFMIIAMTDDYVIAEKRYG